MIKEFSELVGRIYWGSQNVSRDEFQKWAFGSLQGYIHFDTAVWLNSVIHPKSDTAKFHTQYFYNQPSRLLADWMKCKGATTFPRKLFSAPGTSFLCTPSQDMLPEVAAHCRKYGIEQIVSTALIEPVTDIREMISLYRSEISQPFNEHDRYFMQCLMPHLSAAWKMCRTKKLHSIGQIKHRSDVAEADCQGFLQIADSNFTGLLLEEWPGWQGPRLPDELVNAIHDKCAAFKGNKVTISLSYAANEHVLLLGRQKLSVDWLTKRELEIANFFASGTGCKEIAAKLQISHSTVRNHLARVYQKLDVSDKAELAAHLHDSITLP